MGFGGPFALERGRNNLHVTAELGLLFVGITWTINSGGDRTDLIRKELIGHLYHLFAIELFLFFLSHKLNHAVMVIA